MDTIRKLRFSLKEGEKSFSSRVKLLRDGSDRNELEFNLGKLHMIKSVLGVIDDDDYGSWLEIEGFEFGKGDD